MSDHQLEAAVMQALADNPHVHPDEIAVEADKGEVTLRGTVGGPLERVEAVRTARRVPGVRKVDDLLSAQPMTGDRLTDADTEAAVLEAFVYDDELPAIDIDVKAHGESVTLRGTVDSQGQIDRAARVAKSVGGVEYVQNELEVRSSDPAEPVTSADIAEVAAESPTEGEA